jgi:hypothetical protein
MNFVRYFIITLYNNCRLRNVMYELSKIKNQYRLNPNRPILQLDVLCSLILFLTAKNESKN